MNGVLDTYLQETLGGHQSTLQKNREKVGKIEETWVRTKPKNSYEAEKIIKEKEE